MVVKINQSISPEDALEKVYLVFSEVAEWQRQHLQGIKKFIEEYLPIWIKKKNEELEKNEKENHHFNPLRSIKIKETDHSKILGELLNPEGSHGKNYLFLHSFLDMIKIDKPKEGTWNVYIESCSVDILLKRDDPLSVVIIENKANSAVDQEGQLYRYWFENIYSIARDQGCSLKDRNRFRVVYAPPFAFSLPSEQSQRKPDNYMPYPNLIDEMPDEVPSEIVDSLSFSLDFAPWLLSLANDLCNEQEAEISRIPMFLRLYAEIWRIDYESTPN